MKLEFHFNETNKIKLEHHISSSGEGSYSKFLEAGVANALACNNKALAYFRNCFV